MENNNLCGRRFGKLVAIQQTLKTDQYGYHFIRCRCDCGKTCFVESYRLQDRTVRGCYECNKNVSGLERQIMNYLEDHNLEYCTQFTYSDLKGSGGGLLRFDFRVKRNDDYVLIEANGRQHYEQDKDKPDYGKQQREQTDMAKLKYCQMNDIYLQIIRYDEDVNKRMDDIFKVNMKKCILCGQWKPLTEFYYMADRNSYRARCKPCYLKSDTRKSHSKKKHPEQELVEEASV